MKSPRSRELRRPGDEGSSVGGGKFTPRLGVPTSQLYVLPQVSDEHSQILQIYVSQFFAINLLICVSNWLFFFDRTVTDEPKFQLFIKGKGTVFRAIAFKVLTDLQSL